MMIVLANVRIDGMFLDQEGYELEAGATAFGTVVALIASITLWASQQHRVVPKLS